MNMQQVLMTLREIDDAGEGSDRLDDLIVDIERTLKPMPEIPEELIEEFWAELASEVSDMSSKELAQMLYDTMDAEEIAERIADIRAHVEENREDDENIH